jgi:hypothetical protein
VGTEIVENALHGDFAAMLTATFLILITAAVATLAVRGAWAIWQARPGKENGPSTATADTLAALLEDGEAPGATIEERLEALALGLKNVRHRQSMLDGRVNKLDPPAAKGKSNGADGATALPGPRTRNDIMREWRLKNAGK